MGGWTLRSFVYSGALGRHGEVVQLGEGTVELLRTQRLNKDGDGQADEVWPISCLWDPETPRLPGTEYDGFLLLWDSSSRKNF